MTEKEAKAIKWMKSVRDDAVATLDHIAKNEPNVSPMLYAGRKEKAEIILNAFDKLEKSRALGAVKELREAMEKQMEKKLKLYGDFEDGKLLCPNCEEDLMDLIDCGFNNCPYCGQAIDWTESREEE